MKRSITTSFTVLAAVSAAALLPQAAQAGSSFTYRSSGVNLSADWVSYEADDFGNTHYGWLYTYDAGDSDAVDLYITDFMCDPGEVPWGDEEGGQACDYVGDRYGFGYDVEVSVDKKLTAGTLVGEVDMYTYDPETWEETYVGTMAIDLTWTGEGDLNSYRTKYHENYDGTVVKGDFKVTSRSATVVGMIGATDVSMVESSGWMSTYREMSRSRTK